MKQVLCFLIVLVVSFGVVSAREAATGPWISWALTVNETYWQPCIATAKIPAVTPGQPTPSFSVGDCDFGTFNYTLTQRAGSNNVTLSTIFYSHVIEDASPPSCTNQCILFDRKRNEQDGSASGGPVGFQCTSCTVMDSREGFHMTTYSFTVISWTDSQPIISRRG